MKRTNKFLCLVLMAVLLTSMLTPCYTNSEELRSKTTLLIGQTYQDEFEGYVSGIGTAPAGTSHYGEIYTGTINQGDDGKYFDDSAPYLHWVSQNYPNATALIAISIKDNPIAGGYGHLNPHDPNGYDPSCVYKATKDIAYTNKWDANIKKFAQKFKHYPNITFLVRIGYEVNLLMMANASGQEFTTILDKYNAMGINIYDDISLVDPADIDIKAYHDAYNKIARMIRDEEGASNVKFVYHPVRGFGEVKALYPGNQYVDYIGFSAFNHDLSIGTDEANDFVRTIGYDGSRIDSNLQQSLDWSSSRKPILIAEAAYQKAPTEWAAAAGASHSNAFLEYIDRLIEVIEAYNIQYLTYINSNWVGHHWPAHWGDSRVEAFSDVKAYWMNKVVHNPNFIHYSGSSSTEKPEAVSGLRATPADSQVTLNWNASAGAATYDIEYDSVRLSTTLTSKLISNLTNDRTYVFKVIPINTNGSGPSATITAKPQSIQSGGLIGSYANGETKQVQVILTASGMYRLDVTGEVGVVSQLISSKLGSVDGGMAAIDYGRVSSIYFHNVQPGALTLSIQSHSDSTVLQEVRLWDPNNQEILY